MQDTNKTNMRKYCKYMYDIKVVVPMDFTFQ